MHMFTIAYCATWHNEHISRHLLRHLAQYTCLPSPTAPLGTMNIPGKHSFYSVGDSGTVHVSHVDVHRLEVFAEHRVCVTPGDGSKSVHWFMGEGFR
jgi:hypothetical protein